MLTLPDAIVALLVPFATLFTSPTWRKAQVLLVGAILTPGQRTVAAALRVMGRSDQRDYARYHEVLNRAVWSSRQAARILLVLLLQHLDGGDGPLIFGIDETLERRRGAKIRALDRRQLVLPVTTTIFAGRYGVIIRYGGTVDYRPTSQAIEAETYGRQDTGNGSGQGWDERAFSAQVAEWPIAVAGETGASVAHSAGSLRRGVGG